MTTVDLNFGRIMSEKITDEAMPTAVMIRMVFLHL